MTGREHWNSWVILLAVVPLLLLASYQLIGSALSQEREHRQPQGPTGMVQSFEVQVTNFGQGDFRLRLGGLLPEKGAALEAETQSGRFDPQRGEWETGLLREGETAVLKLKTWISVPDPPTGPAALAPQPAALQLAIRRFVQKGPQGSQTTVRLANLGGRALGPIVVFGVVPRQFHLVAARAGEGRLEGEELAWTLSGLAAGASAEIQMQGFQFIDGTPGKGISFVGQLGGEIGVLQVWEDLLFAGEGPRLTVWSLEGTQGLQREGRTLVLADLVRDVAPGESWAVVAAGRAGLAVVQLSDPSNPVVVATVRSADRSLAVAFQEGFAYLADGRAGLRIFDLSDPFHPLEVGSLSFDGEFRDLALSNGYVLVATDRAGLRVVDVSDPANPFEVGAYEGVRTVESVVIQGARAYLAAGRDGLRVLDLQDPSQPAEIGNFRSLGPYEALAVQEPWVAVAAGWAGMRLLDVSDVAAIREASSYTEGGWVSTVALLGGLAFTGGLQSDLQVLDLSNPLQPRGLVSLPQPRSPRSVRVSDSIAVLAEGDRGVRLVDVSLPQEGRTFAFYDTPGTAHQALLWQNRLYVADGDGGVLVLDLVGNSPVPLTTLDTGGPATGLFLQDPYLFVASGDGGLAVLELTDPSRPRLLSQFPLAGWAVDVLVENSLAFLSLEDGGLSLIDVTRPDQPREVGFYSTSGGITGTAALNGFLLVASGGSGLRVLDVSQPSVPREVGQWTERFVRKVRVSEDLVWVATEGAGVFALELSEEGELSVLGAYDSVGAASDVFLWNGQAYLADGRGGLTVLQPSGVRRRMPMVRPQAALVGSQIEILGLPLSEITSVEFPGQVTASFLSALNGQARVVVPEGARSGHILVHTREGAVPTARPFQVIREMVLSPSDDSQAKSSRPERNYGDWPTLRVREGDPSYVSYLKFEVPVLEGFVQSARLQLYVVNPSRDGGDLLASASHLPLLPDRWSERDLSWLRRPLPQTGIPLASLGPVSAGSWVEVDVTSFVRRHGQHSFALRSSSSDSVFYSSKEGEHPPRLIIQYITQ